MRWWRLVWENLSVTARRRREEELEREIRGHLDLEAEEQEGSGVAREHAPAAARRLFGNVTQVKEETRGVWTWATGEEVLQDVRYALRSIGKSRGFSAVAVLSLAIGIGATTAVYSVLDAVVLRPLPVEDPGSLVILRPELGGRRFALFYPLFEELRRSQKSLAGMFAIQDEPYLKAAFGNEAPRYVRASLVSGNYFQVLGVQPVLGRLLTPQEEELGTCVAVLSHAYWRAAFQADTGILGRTVQVRDKVCPIVGVAAAGFSSHQAGYAPELWVPIRPLTDANLLASRSMAFFSGVMGRLREGRSRQEAEAELTALYQGMQPERQPSPRPGEKPIQRRDFRMAVLPGGQGLDLVRAPFGKPLWLALAVVGVVLLIAAMNVANLLLARGVARSKELATRAALGAGRIRLLRLVTVEGGVLAALGGSLGVALAVIATPLLAGAVSITHQPIVLETRFDLRVLGVAVAATMMAVLATGLLPALRLAGAELQPHIAGAGRSTSSHASRRLARMLVVLQVALSLVLVTGAGLLLRTMLGLMGVDPGFHPNDVVVMDVRDTEPSARFGEAEGAAEKARRASVYRNLEERLQAIAGVQSASLSWLGLFGSSYVGLNVYDVEQPEQGRFTLVDYVTPRYFETVGMELAQGRRFGEGDQEGALRVAVVNEAFVRERIAAGREAIGRRLVMTYADDKRPWTIVGVVRDAKYNDLREKKTEPMMWVPVGQAPFKITSISLRVRSGAGAGVIREARTALAEVSPYVMVRNVKTLRARLDRATARERLLLQLAGGFGGIALLLTAIGLHGMLAYGVARRRREIGIRMALGEGQWSVVRSIVRDGLVLVALGAAVGVPFALAGGRLLQSFLFGVSGHDSVTLVSAVGVLAVVGLVSAWGPARRASTIDPVVALRFD